jgi:hypothetical protein
MSQNYTLTLSNLAHVPCVHMHVGHSYMRACVHLCASLCACAPMSEVRTQLA